MSRLPDEIALFRMIRKAGRTDAAKAKAVAEYLKPLDYDFDRDGDRIILPRIKSAELIARFMWFEAFESARSGALGVPFKSFDQCFAECEAAQALTMPPEVQGSDPGTCGMEALQGRNETQNSPPQPPKED